LTEIVAQGRSIARNADVIHVELGMKRVSNDGVREKLAELEGYEFSLYSGLCALLAHPNETLASHEADFEDFIPFFADQIVLIREVGILWVLDERIGETISDCETLEGHVEVSSLFNNVRANGWDIVAGIGLTGDVEIAICKLRVLSYEAF